MAKRKRSSVAAVESNAVTLPPPPMLNGNGRRTSKRAPAKAALDPNTSRDVIDGATALRASPDGEMNERIAPKLTNGVGVGSDSPLSDLPDVEPPKSKRKAPAKKKAQVKTEDQDEDAVLKTPQKKSAARKGEDEPRGDPEADDVEEGADPEELKEALARPPAVNSDYLPLPWKGRLGYACLCTYLRNSNPTVFSSRTTRIASILEHRHPLKDPSQPEHPTRNRPDKEKPADIRLGQRYVEQLCLANVHDMKKMLRWNDRYGIKFMRLSSEAFPFASHAEYGYKLAPFASEALAEVGKVVAELGHRVTTHPGQFSQLGSPRKQVIDASFRDLEYHDEMLSLLKLPPQQNRDAVMILHMGGVFGDKAATLDRFRENYAKLSDSIKRRLVLENDDVSWSVHDLLPVCNELNIPFVLDFHHNNIIFDSTQIREGTKDIMALFPEIRETWTRKDITPKMHYSEPTPAAITGRQRRKHNPRVATLPPCPNDMDLMIEAKDKEQAVFELMRSFKLPGFDTFSDIIPNVRSDDNKVLDGPKRKATPKTRGKKAAEDYDDADEEPELAGSMRIAEEDVGMGGPDGRVYWPPGMEEWLRPVKRVVKKKDPSEKMTSAEKKKAKTEPDSTAATETVNGDMASSIMEEDTPALKKAKTKAASAAKPAAASRSRAKPKKEPTPTTTDEEIEEKMAQAQEELKPLSKRTSSGRKSARATKAPRRSYKEEEDEDEDLGA